MQAIPLQDGVGLVHVRVLFRDCILQREEDAEGIQGDHDSHEDHAPSTAGCIIRRKSNEMLTHYTLRYALLDIDMFKERYKHQRQMQCTNSYKMS